MGVLGKVSFVAVVVLAACTASVAPVFSGYAHLQGPRAGAIPSPAAIPCEQQGISVSGYVHNESGDGVTDVTVRVNDRYMNEDGSSGGRLETVTGAYGRFCFGNLETTRKARRTAAKCASGKCRDWKLRIRGRKTGTTLRAVGGRGRAVLRYVSATDLRDEILGAIENVYFRTPDLSPDEPVLHLYGKAGTFGRLAASSSVQTHSVVNWGVEPGQAPFFPQVMSDGTVLFANMTQTYNQLLRSQCSMVVSCFNPTAATCYDDQTGSVGNFANIHIPNRGENFFVPGGVPCDSLGPFEAFGADVSDVQRVVDATGTERLMFNSVVGSISRPVPESFPVLGTLSKQGGAWRVDAGSLRWPEDLQASELAGVGTNVACPDSQQFGTPNCGGLNEVAVFPVSGHIIGVEYFASTYLVYDTTGEVQAAYQQIDYNAPCGGTGTTSLHPREVETDPTSVLGDERFMIGHDSLGDPRGNLVQEFSYDATTGTIRPVTNPFFPSGADVPGPACRGGARQGSHVTYDASGNLWVATNVGPGAGPTHIYLRDGDTGFRRPEVECAYSADPDDIGDHCLSDLSIGALGGASALARWGWNWSANIFEDPVTRTIVSAGYNGYMGFTKRVPTATGAVFSASGEVDLQLRNLPALADHSVIGSKAVLDTARRELWMPTGVPENVYACSNFFDCVWAVGVERDHWMFKLELDQFLARDAQVTEAEVPSSISPGSPLMVRLTANVTGPLSERSALYVYSDHLADARTPITWTTESCSGETCTFAAEVSGNITAGSAAALSWRAVIEDTWKSTHTVGLVLRSP